MKTHSGYVSIIGRPNVGKSTLLNHLIGEKIAGVSPKPQTTRSNVRGILSQKKGQIVFLDTPGLHDPKDPLGSWMFQEVESSFEGVDLIYWMVLPAPMHPFEVKILELIKKVGKPVFLLVNQIDRYPKPEILPVLERFQSAYPFKEYIPISAKTGDQVKLLISKTFEYLPAAPAFFPEDQLSDQNERFIASEMIREKLYLFTGEEIPYATAVLIEQFKERNEQIIDLSATIIVDKESQKAIVIGKQGTKLKEIGTSARLDLERFLGRKVFLQLWVKVYPNWKRNPQLMKELGYQ